MTTLTRQKLIKTLIVSICMGFLAVIIFPFVDNAPWSIVYIPGSFALGFVPVFLCMMFDSIIARKSFKKMHLPIHIGSNFLVYSVIILGSILAIVLIFGLSSEISNGTEGITEVLQNPDTVNAFIIIEIFIFFVNIYVLLNSFLGKGVFLKLLLG